MAPLTAEQKAAHRAAAEEDAEEVAWIAQTLFTAFLTKAFTHEEAFELTKTVVYEALKDADLL